MQTSALSLYKDLQETGPGAMIRLYFYSVRARKFHELNVEKLMMSNIAASKASMSDNPFWERVLRFVWSTRISRSAILRYITKQEPEVRNILCPHNYQLVVPHKEHGESIKELGARTGPYKKVKAMFQARDECSLSPYTIARRWQRQCQPGRRVFGSCAQAMLQIR